MTNTIFCMVLWVVSEVMAYLIGYNFGKLAVYDFVINKLKPLFEKMAKKVDENDG